MKEAVKPLSNPMAYLVDSDYLINALAGKPEAIHTIKRLAPYKLAISIISIGEIYHGIYTTTNPEAHSAVFQQFIAPFRVFTLTEPVMALFGEIRAHLERQGTIISDFDILIGATALYYKLTLLTNNLRHFERIARFMPKLRIYKLN